VCVCVCVCVRACACVCVMRNYEYRTFMRSTKKKTCNMCVILDSALGENVAHNI
jgi:hypothetical protein